MSEQSILEIGMVYTLHEMKNPLTSIILTLELLEAGDVEDAQAYYAILKKNIELINKSVNELCACYEEKLGDGHNPATAFTKDIIDPGLEI